MDGKACIVNQMNSLEKSHNSALLKNKQLDAKIEQLKQAQRHVKKAEEHANETLRQIDRFEVPGNWAGGRHNKFTKSKEGKMASTSRAYLEEIKDLDGAISKEISNLRSQKNYFAQLIARTNRGIEDLRRELARMN